ncbi:MAG: hypothetical protein OXF84_05580 [Bacteroidetes bacterium]|nr:hypothetical protein [Bacteroidota bacterium]
MNQSDHLDKIFQSVDEPITEVVANHNGKILKEFSRSTLDKQSNSNSNHVGVNGQESVINAFKNIVKQLIPEANCYTYAQILSNGYNKQFHQTSIVQISKLFNFYGQSISNLSKGESTPDLTNTMSLFSGKHIQVHNDLTTQIKVATNHEDIFDILDIANQEKIAKRLRYLHEITNDDDPEDPPMEFLSLMELSLFFITNGKSLPYPQIGISPHGLLQSEWRSKKGIVVLKFLTDGKTRFAGSLMMEDHRQTIQGSGTKKYALTSIAPFIDQI